MDSRTESVQRYECDRRFQVWKYTASHSQLLLRSVRDDDHATRIDVLFKSVSSIALPTHFEALSIERQGKSFVLSGRDWTGRIDAAVCIQAEDTGEDFDASPFEASFGP